MASINNSPLEHLEQVAFVQWLEWNKIIFASIPNSNAMSSLKPQMAVKIMAKLKAEGIQKGFFDLLVFCPSVIVFIEMKRQKGSSVSDEQKYWQEKIKKYPYAKAYICYGSDEAIKVVKEWL